MEYLEFIIYGLIQGLTEFIPVSSTAHLKIISLFLGIDDPGASLSAIIQFGSVLALVWYFRNDIFKFRSQSSKKIINYFSHERLIKSIFIGTIPIILIGGTIKIFLSYFFYDIIRSNLSIALVSLMMALVMYIADRSKKGSINLRDLYEALSYRGMQKFLLKYPLTSSKEYIRSFSKFFFTKSLQKLIPDLKSYMLTESSAGIRAQLMNNKGELEQDFVIKVKKNLISILNAPSPAATSSLSIAKYIFNYITN